MFILNYCFIFYLLLSFISNWCDGIICKCDSCQPKNTTCETDNLCFVSYEFDSKVHAYGCLSKDKHIPGTKFPCYEDPREGMIRTECCDKDLCNSIEPLAHPDHTSILTRMFASSLNYWEQMSLIEKFLIFITIFVIILSLSILFLALYIKKQKPDNYKKDIEFSLASSDLLLESGQNNSSLKQLIDSSSGSGSGLPTLVQRSIARQIQLQELIGKGRFGQVWKACWRGESVAVKIFLSREERSWLREVEIYQTGLLRHDNILTFVAADNYDSGTGTQLWLITNYHERGSLYEYLSKYVLTLPDLIKMAYSIANGLAHLHMEIVGNRQGKPAIAHRDLKSKNILVKNDGECVIADLGLAVKLIDDKLDIPINNREGTKRYLAPEVLEETINLDQFDSFRRADIYAFGLVIWELCIRTSFMTNMICQDHLLPYEGDG